MIKTPSNIELEKDILGNIIIDSEVTDELILSLEPDDFYDTINRKIFEVITKLYNDSKPYDIVIISNILRGDLPKISSFLNAIIDEYVPISDVYFYTQKLKEKRILRELLKNSYQIQKQIERAENSDSSVEDVLNEAQRAITEIDFVSNETIASFEKLTRPAIERYEKLNNKIDTVAIATGFYPLDKLIVGFRKQKFYILAARPAMGKSALMLNFAINAANQNKKSLIFSLEMSKESLIDRAMAVSTKINSGKFISGGFSGNDFDTIVDKAEELATMDVYIDDFPELHYQELRRKVMRYKKKYGIDIIFIDYLTLLDGDKGDNRVNEVSSISRNLLKIARLFNIPVVALAQLNRTLENRADKRPIMADLRESGQIEQDADVIMFLYRDEIYQKIKDKNQGWAEVNVAKNRDGATGTVLVGWDEKITKFYNRTGNNYEGRY